MQSIDSIDEAVKKCIEVAGGVFGKYDSEGNHYCHLSYEIPDVKFCKFLSEAIMIKIDDTKYSRYKLCSSPELKNRTRQ